MIAAYSAYGSAGASTRVRLYDWFDHLGLRADRHEYLGNGANPVGVLARRPLRVARAELDLRRRGRRPADQVAIISREASPLSTGSLEQRILSTADHGVFDFDDAIWLRAPGPRGWLDQHRKTRRAVAAADVVIAGNDLLADWASAHARTVVMIPSCVEPSDYRPKSSWALDDRPRLVWLGSPSTEQYVVDIAPALDRVCRATGAVLTVISGSASTPRPLDQWEWVTRVPGSSEAARTTLASSDVAIAPLRDDDYARGKCAYKLLQYAASALPMVGSPVGANALALARFGAPGPVTHDDWEQALTAVIEEPAATREARARAGVLAIDAHYTFDAWADHWASAVMTGARE